MSLLGNKLSLPLPVIGLVSYYLTNYLIGPRPLLKRLASLLKIKIDFQIMGNYPIFRPAMPRFRVRTKVLLTRSPLSLAPRYARRSLKFKMQNAKVKIIVSLRDNFYKLMREAHT